MDKVHEVKANESPNAVAKTNDWAQLSTTPEMQWVKLRRSGKAHLVRISKHFTSPRALCGEITAGSGSIDRFALRCRKCLRKVKYDE